MLRSNYFINPSKTPSKSGAVVFFKAQEALDLRPQIAAGLLIAFSVLTLGQVGFVYSQSANEALVSGPITSPEEPITSPEETPPPVDPGPGTGGGNPGNSGNGGNSGNSNGSGNGGGPVGAPSCNDAKPFKAPSITSANVSAPNEVTINWAKAGEPVTHYVISYGLKPQTPLYGNPNIGGKETTSYKVRGLSSGTTYFFKVRASNNCMPGDYSNEVSIRVVNGAKFNTPAVGFKPGVLGQKKVQSTPKPTNKPVVSSAPQVQNQDKPNLFEQVANFFNKLFI